MLRQSEAETIAIAELMKHGLRQNEFTISDKCWEIQFHYIKQAGQCWHDSRVIVLGRDHLDKANKIELENTIKHEVAHALVGPNHNHDAVWQAKVKEIGGNPNEFCGLEDKKENLINVVYDSKGELVKKEKKHIAPLQNKCPICGSTAEETSRATFSNKIFLKLKCGHLISKDKIQSVSYDSWTSQSGKSLFPYQIEGAKFIESSNGRCLIADEPGLGKTAQAISFAKFHSAESLPILWICKTTLKIQAVKEFLDWCDDSYFPCVIDSSKSFIMPNMKVYIISMDLLRRINPDKLKSIGIKTIVADEIQHFKNPDSARTQELRRLVKDVDFFIALSGTPWKNRGSEYFSVLNMLDPAKFPTYHGFKQRWVDYQYDYKEGKTTERGIRNIPQFREYTKEFIIRRMRDDVLPDLPKINRQIRYVELESIYGEAYEKAEGKVADIIRQASIGGTRMNMASLGAELMKLKHITGLAKVDVTVEDIIEFLEDTPDERKLTVFIHHIDVGDQIELKLNKYLTETSKSKCLRLFGGRGADERNEIVEKFEKKIENRVMIASTLASGEGLNLQFCTDAIIVERQWNPANEEQAELRFSRPGSLAKESIRIPYMICADTVDQLLTEIVEKKRLNYRRTMNVKDEQLKWEENEIMQELAEMIMNRRYKK